MGAPNPRMALSAVNSHALFADELPMKPYKVRIEWETVILARDETHAMMQAESVIREGDDECDMVNATEIKSLEELPQGWNKDCRPWGETDPMDRTLGQMLPVNNESK